MVLQPSPSSLGRFYSPCCYSHADRRCCCVLHGGGLFLSYRVYVLFAIWFGLRFLVGVGWWSARKLGWVSAPAADSKGGAEMTKVGV